MPFSVAKYLGKGKVYRIGVFGGSESGKTSLLAALGLDASVRVHPTGIVCARRTDLSGLPKPQSLGTADNFKAARTDPVVSFHLANQYIGEAERQLRAKQSPAPTATPPLLLAYDFAAPGRGQFTVELTDYAGESLTPDASDSDNARKLYDWLRQVDALLVFAEVPRPGQPADESPRGLRLLHQAMMKLPELLGEGGKLTRPVALLLTKWDRRDGTASEGVSRDEAVQRFLADSSPHRVVWQQLQSIASCPAVYPVSAYGAAVTDDATKASADRPARVPLPSFGLEEPFVWACRHVDDADLTELKADGGSRWRWLDFKLHARARELASRLPRGSAGSVAAEVIRRKAGWYRFTRRAAAGASTACVLLFTAQSVASARLRADNGQWAEANKADDPETRRPLLIDYLADRPSGAHRLEAERQIEEIDKQYADGRWTRVTQATSPEPRLGLLTSYLADERCRWNRPEAERLKRGCEAELDNLARWDQHRGRLRQVQADYEAAKAGNRRELLAKVEQAYRELPSASSDWAADDWKAYQTLGDNIRSAVTTLVRGEDER
jgi:hypothetical protein